MMRGKVLTHGIAVFAILFFGALALSSTASSPNVAVAEGEEIVVSSVTTTQGAVHNMQDPNNNDNMVYASLKPYTVLGMVFATSTTNFDEDGFEFASEESILIMLLREAHKLGADDILNFRMSENTKWIETVTVRRNTSSNTDNQSGPSNSSSSASTRETRVRTRTVTTTGSAMAIKYID